MTTLDQLRKAAELNGQSIAYLAVAQMMLERVKMPETSAEVAGACCTLIDEIAVRHIAIRAKLVRLQEEIAS